MSNRGEWRVCMRERERESHDDVSNRFGLASLFNINLQGLFKAKAVFVKD